MAIALLTVSGAWAGDDLQRVEDINPGPPASIPFDPQLTTVGNTLFFTADDGVHGIELWKSGGTAENTKMVKNIRPDTDPSPSSFARNLFNLNGTLYFVAFDGANVGLWKSDGTRTGTRRITPPGLHVEYELAKLGNELFFPCTEIGHGTELCKTEGTLATTKRVKEIGPAETGSGPEFLTAVGDTLYFAASNQTDGTELWKTQGTAASTRQVKDINPNEEAPAYGSQPEELTNVSGVLFFSAFTDADGRELWKSGGTAMTTVQVEDIRLGEFGSAPTELTALGATLLFSADEGTDGDQRARELWRSGGTQANTTIVKDIDPGTGSTSSSPTELTKVGNMVYFEAQDGENGYELWKSDGTEPNTNMVENLEPGSGSSSPSKLANIGGTLYFDADVDVGNELYSSKGTPASTGLVADINPTGGSFPADMTKVGPVMFFAATDGNTGKELWRFVLP